MAPQPQNLIMGPATLYHGAFGAVPPADLNTSPAPSSWTDFGITLGGVKWTINPTYKEYEADQIIDVPGAVMVKRKVMVGFTIAEATLDNLRRAMNLPAGAITNPWANVARLTPEFGPNASQQLNCAILMDGLAPSTTGLAKRRRVVLRKTKNIDPTEMNYKPDEQFGIPVAWQAFYVDSNTSPFFVDDDQSP